VDKSLLVTAGQNLLTFLEREGAEVETAAWLLGPDMPWRLWLAPKKYVTRHSFYLTLAQVLSKHNQNIGDLEVSDIHVVEPGSPIVKELKRFRSSVGPGFPMWLTSERLGGFYVLEGIILKVGS
jgi:hypothetical protein